MKKTPLMLLAVIAAFYFAGCKKIIEQIHNNPAQEFKYCDIKTFKVWFRDNYNEFTVTYNSKGQPKDVIGKYPGSPPENFSLEQHFRYDKKGRLTDWITNYPGLQLVWQWHTYHYISPAKVLDTSYAGSGSLITDPHPEYNNQGAVVGRILEFDKYGRIAKITIPAENAVQNIVYDANGNTSAYSAYDTSINMMRTNKIWMFVNLNYNANNFTAVAPATISYTYNSYMLPTSLTVFGFTGGWFMSTLAASGMTIEYDCDGTSKYY